MPFFLLAIIAFAIAIATIVECHTGTPFVLDNIYGAWWMKALWTLMSLLSVWQIVKRRLWNRLSIFILHTSFLIILAGALTTSLTANKGYIHLRKDIPSSSFINKANRQITEMPFAVRLDSFAIDYYPGTQAPSDYISHVTLLTTDSTIVMSERISMNNIMEHDGYRMYQTSYDEDGEGSWLTVNHDPWGIRITYAGYALLALSALLILIMRAGKLRTLLHHPSLRKAGMLPLIMFMPLCVHAESSVSTPVIRLDEADTYKTKQVVYNDRVAPFNTLAIDFVTKLYGKPSFNGLSPEQVVISWTLHPEQWNNVKIIKIKNKQLRHLLGIPSEHASINDLFDDAGHYKLTDLYKKESGTRSKLEKAIIETDEKLAIVQMLTGGTLIKPLPDNMAPLPEHRIVAEVLYNIIPFGKILFMLNLSAGFILLALYLFKRTTGRTLTTVADIALYASTLFLLLAYILRWYISDRIPLSNGYETMLFVALATLIISCTLHRRLPIVAPFGFIISGFTLLVSHLAHMNPQITPLMPVLQSPLLSSHVATIMVSYALFAFMAINAITSLSLMRKPSGKEQAERLTTISHIMLYPATLLLTIGIFIGAVWANVSWGSYWSWDPKEVWALITMIVYGIAFHDTSIPWLRTNRNFNIYIALSFLTVLMTYFGVNYLLGGMHSYAN